jgi:hypothetical protein
MGSELLCGEGAGPDLLQRQTSVPQPRGTPRKVPVSIGPPGTTAGRSTDVTLEISQAGLHPVATQKFWASGPRVTPRGAKCQSIPH